MKRPDKFFWGKTRGGWADSGRPERPGSGYTVRKMPDHELDTVAGLMSDLRQGRSEALGRLTEVLYPELRRLAAAKMARERSDHTWQPTVLVHELFLELTRLKKPLTLVENSRDRAAFLA